MKLKEQKKQPKPAETNLISFKCELNDVFKCFIKNTEGIIDVCNCSPCPLNIYNFGVHGRIIRTHLKLEKWEECIYYFDRLLDQLPISCDLDLLNDNSNIKNKDDSPVCRLFKISFKLKEILEELESYQDQELLEKDGTSVKRKEFYDSDKFKFKKNLTGNLELLKRLAFSKRLKRNDSKDYKQILLELYDTAIKANKMGLHVETGVGSALETGFEDAAKGAGLKTKDLAEFNKKRVEQANKEAELNKFKNEMFVWLKEGKDLTPEMKKKLKALGMV